MKRSVLIQSLIAISLLSFLGALCIPWFLWQRQEIGLNSELYFDVRNLLLIQPYHNEMICNGYECRYQLNISQSDFVFAQYLGNTGRFIVVIALVAEFWLIKSGKWRFIIVLLLLFLFCVIIWFFFSFKGREIVLSAEPAWHLKTIYWQGPLVLVLGVITLTALVYVRQKQKYSE